LAGLICDHAIMALAVAQQFHDRAWRSPAGDDRIARLLNARNVEGGYGLIIRRARRYGKCGRGSRCFGLCRCRHGQARISIARRRRQGRCRGDCGAGFNRRLAPQVVDTEEKRGTTDGDKRRRRRNYSAFRCNSH
jgi:hypothetical protein